MVDLPDRPFLTDDFSPDGAGIDFLGLRWVNLKILDQYLLPGVNNATEDFGVYCLGAWLPWKFQSVFNGTKTMPESRFRRFREAIEVTMSFVSREDSPSTKRFGAPHRRIGDRQKLSLPGKLTFNRVQRTDATSIYAAPLYGPSLRNLMLARKAPAADGTATDVWAAVDDGETTALVTAVEESLAGSRYAEVVSEICTRELSVKELDDLGMHGLHPAYCRRFRKKVKQAFLRKLLPADESNARTLTARLIIRTLRSSPGLSVSGLRHVWHSGLIRQERPQRLSEPGLSAHRDRWRMHMIRQYQRYVLEEYLRCFEVAVVAGCRTLDEITAHALGGLEGLGKPTSKVREVFAEEAAPVSRAQDNETVAQRWQSVVHAGHPSYLDAIALAEDGNGSCGPATRMLARWWFGSMMPIMDASNSELAVLGGEDRLSMRWFFRWVQLRMHCDLRRFVRDVFEQLIFAQHVRVALSRFDGQGQRLRFALGDAGIVPTRSSSSKLGSGLPGWMADRLAAFVNLLCDVSVLEQDDQGRLTEGPLANEVLRA